MQFGEPKKQIQHGVTIQPKRPNPTNVQIQEIVKLFRTIEKKQTSEIGNKKEQSNSKQTTDSSMPCQSRLPLYPSKNEIIFSA